MGSAYSTYIVCSTPRIIRGSVVVSYMIAVLRRIHLCCSYQQAGSRMTTEAIARDLIANPNKTLFLLNGAVPVAGT